MNFKQYITSHKSIVESFLSLSVLGFVDALLPLLTLPYILRIVGASNYGVYAYIYVIINYLQQFNIYGFNFSATKQIAQNRNSNEYVSQVYSTVTICRLLLFVAGAVCILLCSPLLFSTRIEFVMFVVGLGIILGDSLNPVWLYQGMEKMRYITLVNLCAKLLFTILIFVFIRVESDYVYIILYNSLGYIAAGMLSTILAYKQFHIRFHLPTWKDIVYQFREGFAIFSSTIGINLYRNANTFILKFFVSDAAVGIYAAAEKIIKGLQMLVNPIAQALFPHMSQRMKNQDLRTNITTIKNVAWRYSLVLIVGVVLTFAFAKWIVWLVCGKEFMDATLLVQIMCPVILIAGLNYTLGIVGLVNMGQSKQFLYAVLVTGSLSIVALLLSASSYGIIAAASVFTISEVVLLGYILGIFIHLKKYSLK